MATNQVSFYYAEDLQVTKHGDHKVSAALNGKPFGTAVKRNTVTGELEIAANSKEFQGIAHTVILTVQGNDADSMKLVEGKRALIGVGKDYVFVSKGMVAITGNKGDKVAVSNGAFVAPTPDTNEAVGEIVNKFANGEIAVRIY
jgi:phosphohistidine swiveling domain-containing protein